MLSTSNVTGATLNTRHRFRGVAHAFDTAFRDSLLPREGIKSGLAYNRQIEYAERTDRHPRREDDLPDFMMNRLAGSV
jgi:hypothetical protein